MKPHFHFVTLFPETIQVWLTSSILGRAFNKGLFDFSLYQLREYSEDKHRSVDDSAYGGGGGMVLRIEPLVKVTESLFEKWGRENCKVIYFSPAGKPLNQELLASYSQHPTPHYIFICGHYEGTDQRFLDNWVDEEISLGDFVITGGELPAVAFADALIRRLEGALGHEEGAEKESFSLKKGEAKLLEYPHYTRPLEFRGFTVPSPLLGGNHKEIETWRLNEAENRTKKRRPDLFSNA